MGGPCSSCPPASLPVAAHCLPAAALSWLSQLAVSASFAYRQPMHPAQAHPGQPPLTAAANAPWPPQRDWTGSTCSTLCARGSRRGWSPSLRFMTWHTPAVQVGDGEGAGRFRCGWRCRQRGGRGCMLEPSMAGAGHRTAACWLCCHCARWLAETLPTAACVVPAPPMAPCLRRCRPGCLAARTGGAHGAGVRRGNRVLRAGEAPLLPCQPVGVQS